MREIKFRAWDGGEIVYNSEPEYMGYALFGGFNGEVMQFTGLLDKNGKEIYEGDIVIGENKVLFVVEWWERGQWSIAGFKDIEVIGNIYENPDLLK